MYYSVKIGKYHENMRLSPILLILRIHVEKCCLMFNCFVIEEIPVFEAGGPPIEEMRDHLNNSQEEER